MITPLVLTSKAAQEHLDGIKLDHATLLQGITDQSNKVSQFKAEQDSKKQMDMQETQRATMEQEKTKMEADNSRLEQENKRRELEIKAQALSMP